MHGVEWLIEAGMWAAAVAAVVSPWWERWTRTPQAPPKLEGVPEEAERIVALEVQLTAALNELAEAREFLRQERAAGPLGAGATERLAWLMEQMGNAQRAAARLLALGPDWQHRPGDWTTRMKLEQALGDVLGAAEVMANAGLLSTRQMHRHKWAALERWNRRTARRRAAEEVPAATEGSALQ